MIAGTEVMSLNLSDCNGSYLLDDHDTPLFGPMGIAFYDGTVFDETLPVKIALTITLGICMVLSVIGNICTFAVIVQNRSMRTPTNCYLANLAVTDLLMASFIPIDIYIIWIPEFYPFGGIGCRIHFVIWDCLSNCSLLIITAITVERYLVIKKPFLRQKLMLNSRVYKIIGIAWIVSIIFCIPDIFYFNVIERKKYVFCYFSLTDFVSVILIFETIIFFIIPMATITILYILLAIELKSNQNKLRSSPMSGNQNKDKAVKMLATIAASFLFFWSPYVFLRILMIHPNIEYDDSNMFLWNVVNYLCYNGYMSTAANPILYSLMSRKFRQAFKDFLKGRRTLVGKRKGNQ